MVRLRPATPGEQREAFNECLVDALYGRMPPTDTGLSSAAIDALSAVAEAAYRGQSVVDLVIAARVAFDTEMAWQARQETANL